MHRYASMRIYLYLREYLYLFPIRELFASVVPELSEMIKGTSKKFAIVKFDVISTYGTNPYKVVPLQWVKDTDHNKVLVQYPSKDEVFTEFGSILECNQPLSSWKECSGTLEYVTSKLLFCENVNKRQSPFGMKGSIGFFSFQIPILTG